MITSLPVLGQGDGCLGHFNFTKLSKCNSPEVLSRLRLVPAAAGSVLASEPPKVLLAARGLKSRSSKPEASTPADAGEVKPSLAANAATSAWRSPSFSAAGGLVFPIVVTKEPFAFLGCRGAMTVKLRLNEASNRASLAAVMTCCWWSAKVDIQVAVQLVLK